MPPLYTPTVASINYAPSDVPVHANRSARVYMPLLPASAYGYRDGRYPMVIVANLDGYTVSSPQLVYATDDVYAGGSGNALYGVARLLDSGRAVLDITMCRQSFTYTGGGQIGLGLFHPVSAASQRIQNVNYPFWGKDAMYAVAYCKKNKDNIDGLGSKIRDPGWYGRSAGSSAGQFAQAYNSVLPMLGTVSTDALYGYSTNLAFLAGINVIGVHARWYGDTLTGVPFPNATIGGSSLYGTASSANEAAASQQQLANASYRTAFTVYSYDTVTMNDGFRDAFKDLPWASLYGSSLTQDSIPGRFDPKDFLTSTNFQLKGHGCYGAFVNKYLYPGRVQVFMAQDFSTSDIAGDMITRTFLDPRRGFDSLLQLIIDWTKPDNGV